MSTEFENAVIAFGQSLEARWGDSDARDQARRRLLELIDAEFDGSCFAYAMKCIVGHANATLERRQQQAYNSKAAEPLSPEEELADTIARQKGEDV